MTNTKLSISNSPKVIWITGLSGSGKSTLAKQVSHYFKDYGIPHVLLDGDELRSVLTNNLDDKDNTKQSVRLKLSESYSRLCRIFVEQGLTVIIATISLFHEIHKWNRSNLKGYFEVYLKVPLDILVNRDPKNIYKDYYAGKLKNVAGLDLNIEEPKFPDLILDYNAENSPELLAKKIISKLN